MEKLKNVLVNEGGDTVSNRILKKQLLETKRIPPLRRKGQPFKDTGIRQMGNKFFDTNPTPTTKTKNPARVAAGKKTAAATKEKKNKINEIRQDLLTKAVKERSDKITDEAINNLNDRLKDLDFGKDPQPKVHRKINIKAVSPF